MFSTATNPKKKSRAKELHGFKLTTDGRLIIKDGDDEEDDVKKGRRGEEGWVRTRGRGREVGKEKRETD